ncbi:AAA family ATPase [Bacillus sp. 22446]|uniref:AAA family ATPase n=1 Tax=Bacillus sp. 22446 TaxID=3453918 RepID=UPI003F82F000
MQRPENMEIYEDIDLKLGIKSSLPNVKATLALFILIWKSEGRPAEVKYSVQDGDSIRISDEVMNQLVAYASPVYSGHGISDELFRRTVGNNQLLKSQMEALIVAFELYWKLGKIVFQDNTKPVSSERTGGVRYPKEIHFTTNMDIIDVAMVVAEEKYKKVLLNWLGLNVATSEREDKLLKSVLTALSETAVFKLDDRGQGVIFNQDSIYRKLLTTTATVDINGDKEAKGSLRVLKTSLNDGTNPYLNYSHGTVTSTNDPDLNLADYQKRVSTFLSLSTTKIVGIDEYEEVQSGADETHESNDDYLADSSSAELLKFRTGYQNNDFHHNRIIFGAPGTGKSYTLNRDKDSLLKNGGKYERVTFHPDYSYANFVGTYKPTMVDSAKNLIGSEDERAILTVLLDDKTAQEKYDLLYNKFKDGSDTSGNNSVERNHGHAIRQYVNLISNKNPASEITYEYVPGPFMRTYVKALKNAQSDNPKPYLLIVEEINRANVAAVFGDIFQLLDRDDDNVSEYAIQTSEDVKKYLAKELGGKPKEYSEIKIPDNMFIWATMNSADQGVFPMDTAFKRRWDFTYLGIDDSEEKIVGKTVELGKGANKRSVEWNELRKAINTELLSYKVNEDKLIGPYFLSKKIVPETEPINPTKFIAAFKSKVIMYLFDDAAKQKRQTLFDGCNDKTKYSSICKEFEDKGVFIFAENISNKFPATTPIITEDGAE